ncbi:Pimeloyl-CoA dehydrogenase, large subunit [Agrobacterium deltaense NCPPB 1641]|uniref:Pimeloyl-CoA dehydrogenase, large subunit n=2 Tax=Rhizobium/Agrobacterium group TaxID=227290 RepID=A0A1S7TRU1_9HYPH|nr:Pimeloyl-CoA dehydrogenase, large subunit [Agrobacterium deltaense NCPPB 1641]
MRSLKGREAVALGAQILQDTGWLAGHWPMEWGGAGLSPVERYVLEQELEAVGFPPRDRTALDLAGPVICNFGSLSLKKRYLPQIVSGTEMWCQGFSEPESGSDVNSLRTTATLVGDEMIVEGRKIWTTNAHLADFMFALVRLKVDGVTQRGLTFILIDMRHTNVSIKPIETIDRCHRFNEVVLDKVSVPVSNIVGEPGRGWQNARYLLANERLLLSHSPTTRRRVETLKASARDNSNPMHHHVQFRRKLAEVEIELQALEFAILRVLHADRTDPTMEGLTCAIKVRGAELRQRVGGLELEAFEHLALIMEPLDSQLTPIRNSAIDYPDPFLLQDFLYDVSGSIAGGTTEIQKNLIAGIALGL